MNKMIIKAALVLLPLFVGAESQAVTGVNPSGLNVRSTGPTTAFLTFQGTAGQTATDAFWCGDVTTTGVTTTDPCTPGTLFGRLPKRHDFSRASGTGGASNITDIMTVPASVARRAFQDAKKINATPPAPVIVGNALHALGANSSSFFYVRKFEGAGGTQYVTVTCRLAGGGARTPLALLDVRPAFQTELGDRPIYLFAQGEEAAPFNATIYYNGSGHLKGRWEVLMPGDQQPSADDLLPEASLPIEQRALQKRYTVLKHFDVFLPPTGRVVIKGPKPSKIPTTIKGPYKILLRIEATRDKEGNSKTTTGVVASGGVAGFPMPVLRYYVGTKSDVSQAKEEVALGKLSLMLPLDGVTPPDSGEINFSWVDVPKAELYRIVLRTDQETIVSAVIRSGVSSYTAPPWVKDYAGQDIKWRVRALNQQGSLIAQSRWRALSLQ